MDPGTLKVPCAIVFNLFDKNNNYERIKFEM